MNRRQLAFVVLLNALISLAIALGVAWVIEARRPDPEELAIQYTPPAVISDQAAVTAPTTPPTLSASMPADAPPAADAPADEAVTPESEVASSDEDQIYIVQAGDSLGAIAARFGLSLAELVEANNLENPDFVFSGQRLTIPGRANPAASPTPTAPVVAGQGIRIGELETPGNLLSEAILIINDSNLAVNLQGWRLEREGGPAYTFESVPIFPGGSLWVHSRAGSNTSVALFWNQSSPVWQSGAVARLINPQGDVVTTYLVP